MTRRELREHVFRELFTAEFYPESEEERSSQLQLYFTHADGEELEYPPADVSAEDQAQILERVQAVLEHKTQLDALIEDVSVSWTIPRMNRTDLSILRLGAYELLYDEAIPPKVAINEAVLLARKFGGEESYSFVNGILGQIQKRGE